MMSNKIYARLYWLRRDIGRMVAQYGVGVPYAALTRSLDEKYGVYQ